MRDWTPTHNLQTSQCAMTRMEHCNVWASIWGCSRGQSLRRGALTAKHQRRWTERQKLGMLRGQRGGRLGGWVWTSGLDRRLILG